VRMLGACFDYVFVVFAMKSFSDVLTQQQHTSEPSCSTSVRHHWLLMFESDGQNLLLSSSDVYAQWQNMPNLLAVHTLLRMLAAI